jgi:hypothetical protein
VAGHAAVVAARVSVDGDRLGLVEKRHLAGHRVAQPTLVGGHGPDHTIELRIRHFDDVLIAARASDSSRRMKPSSSALYGPLDHPSKPRCVRSNPSRGEG